MAFWARGTSPKLHKTRLQHKEVIRERFLTEENFQSTVKKSDHAFKREAGPVCSPRRQQTQEWVRKKVVTWTEKRQRRTAVKGAACQALHNRLGGVYVIPTVGSSAGVGSDKSRVSEKLFWQLY